MMLCVVNASAVSYGNPYRGAGRNGYVASSVSYHSASTGLSQTPTAVMKSTSSAVYGSSQRALNDVYAAQQVQGMYTSASAIRGGMTSSDTYGMMFNAPRRSPTHPDDAEECEDCIDLNSDGYCDRCGCDMQDCNCADESGYCWCPVGDGVDVWAMMIALALAYGIHGVWKEKKEAIEG